MLSVLLCFLGSLQATTQARPLTALQELVRVPRTVFGNTAESVGLAVRKVPTTATLESIENPHVPVPNARLTLDYTGIVVTLLIGTYRGTSGLQTVDVTDPSWLTRFNVPTTRSEAEALLGRGIRTTGAELVYEDSRGSDIGPATLTLSFEGTRLVRARWTYPYD
jgi:hypothetical protein